MSLVKAAASLSELFFQALQADSIASFELHSQAFLQKLVLFDPSERQAALRETCSSNIFLPGLRSDRLRPHQVDAISQCIRSVILSDSNRAGYCFMPTSSGKGHVLMVLAGLSLAEFSLQKHIFAVYPILSYGSADMDFLSIMLGLKASALQTQKREHTQILVHDIAILSQLKDETQKILGSRLSDHIQFASVQAHRDNKRRSNLKYLIIDECHWGNASEDESLQSDLVEEVVRQEGYAIGFTASPYHAGKFQKTWQANQIGADKDFNYYLDRGILYPVTLREINLQNARAGFGDGDEEKDLVEKDQVVKFMATTISDTIGHSLGGPSICFFNAIIIPDIIESLFDKRPDLLEKIKVMGGENSQFVETCVRMFGKAIMATDEDITAVKAGKDLLLVSRQKLLVGFNAPNLRHCFISPTNSQITIMQAVGRLMRMPTHDSAIRKKMATLFLTSFSGKKLAIAGTGAEGVQAKSIKHENLTKNEEEDFGDIDTPKKTYTTTSMSFSEAYSLSTPVYYKTEVGFRDFYNETRLEDGNSVVKIGRAMIDPQEFDELDPVQVLARANWLRSKVVAIYGPTIRARDVQEEAGKKIWCCQGKRLLGERGCSRSSREVRLEIHHCAPFEFAQLLRKLGPEGLLTWHNDAKNLQHLVSLCVSCHKSVHAKT